MCISADLSTEIDEPFADFHSKVNTRNISENAEGRQRNMNHYKG